MFVFLGVGGALEYTNPAPKTEIRLKAVQKQVQLGMSALAWVIVGSTFWLYIIDPHTPYYGYYATHKFGIKEFFISMAV